MTTDTTAVRAALIDALHEAAEAATDDWTHVTVCADGVHLRATRRWRPDRDQWDSPTEVEINLDDELPVEAEVDPENLSWWADEVAADLIARVIVDLNDACATEQQDEVEAIEQRLRDQIREARTVLDANAREDGDPIAAYLDAMRRRDEALDEGEREAAQDEMDEAASLLAIWGIAVDPDAMVEGGVYLDRDTGRLAAWDWDPRTTDPETGWTIYVIGVHEDDI